LRQHCPAPAVVPASPPAGSWAPHSARTSSSARPLWRRDPFAASPHVPPFELRRVEALLRPRRRAAGRAPPPAAVLRSRPTPLHARPTFVRHRNPCGRPHPHRAARYRVPLALATISLSPPPLSPTWMCCTEANDIHCVCPYGMIFVINSYLVTSGWRNFWN
jgi:hypothetical protein